MTTASTADSPARERPNPAALAGTVDARVRPDLTDRYRTLGFRVVNR